jgi:demethylmenaquinone methyltransferase / 2-methoxy-6-polyprenyl-1,4-benzoquinol methylase
MPPALREIFSGLAATYERVNHALTLGFDISWRRRAARAAARDGGALWLDVCSGTGDMARQLGRRAAPSTRIVALDFCRPMLDLSAARPRTEGPLEFVLADAARLPFPGGAFDLITVAFATRNLNLSRAALSATFGEFHRALKPGGRYVNLETSQPRFRVVRFFFRAYVRIFVRAVGRRLSGTEPGYAYLSASIPEFYPPEELAGILREAGFSRVAFRRLMFGAAAIHIAVK